MTELVRTSASPGASELVQTAMGSRDASFTLAAGLDAGTFSLIADVTSLIFILLGSLFIFSAAVGVARFGDTMSRVHAVTKPQTTGLLLTIFGSAIRVIGSPEFSVSHRSDLGILLLLILFACMTSPVTAQRIGRIARREGLYGDDDAMSRNDKPAGKSMRRRK